MLNTFFFTSPNQNYRINFVTILKLSYSIFIDHQTFICHLILLSYTAFQNLPFSYSPMRQFFSFPIWKTAISTDRALFSSNTCDKALSLHILVLSIFHCHFSFLIPSSVFSVEWVIPNSFLVSDFSPQFFFCLEYSAHPFSLFVFCCCCQALCVLSPLSFKWNYLTALQCPS